MEAQLSAGIVRLKAAALNIPERDSCGEAVQAVLIPLIVEENARVATNHPRRHAERGRKVACDRSSASKHPYARHGLSSFGGEMPPSEAESQEGIGVLRLRSCFAWRSSHSAQDDRVRLGSEV